MNHPSDLIDELVKTQLKPALKVLGFKSNASTFSRQNGRLVEIISAQKSLKNNANGANFTINLGVFWPEVNEVLSGDHYKSSIKEYDCTLRRRIGQLFDKSEDFWWSVSPNSDIQLIGADVLGKIRTFALPWFIRATSIEEAVKLAQPREAIVFYKLKGEPALAAALLADQMATNKHAKGFYKLLATKLALPIPAG
jgi:hypothetical protein